MPKWETGEWVVPGPYHHEECDSCRELRCVQRVHKRVPLSRVGELMYSCAGWTTVVSREASRTSTVVFHFDRRVFN